VISARDAARVAHPGLIGEHQQVNAALASATVESLQSVMPVTATKLHAGLSKVTWPGRFQVIQRPDGGSVVLDGAHNPDGVETLAAALRSRFPDTKPTMIIGMLGDKNWQLMCRQLASLAGRVLTVPVASDRGAAASDLAAECRAFLPNATEACGSLAEAFAKAEGDSLVVVAGSLYLVGEALEWLGLSPDVSERALNEWTGALPQTQRR
jgi:dihydrofolate synthase/folylpolyglutamate synthase